MNSDLVDHAFWQLFSDLVGKRNDGNFTATQTEENFKKPCLTTEKKNIYILDSGLIHRTLLLTTGRQLQRSLRFFSFYFSLMSYSAFLKILSQEIPTTSSASSTKTMCSSSAQESQKSPSSNKNAETRNFQKEWGKTQKAWNPPAEDS